MKHVLFVFFALLVWAIPASAEEFDLHFIISDIDLTAYPSMTVEDIQLFLNRNSGVLKDRFFRDVDGAQKTASQIIRRSAWEHKINPQVLLVMLQKEQSLITDPTPTIRQLRWATGFAVCDACDVDHPDVKKHGGFANQVDSTAALFRFYLDELNQHRWIKRAGETYTINNIPVTPQTQATALLYTYTPHLEGNRNFKTLWNAWFNRQFPDGMVVKASDSSAIYFLDNGKRRHVGSMDVFNSYFDASEIRIIDRRDLDAIGIGEPLLFPNYSLLRTENRTYLLVDEELFTFASDTFISQLGFNPDEIIHTSETELAQYPRGTMLTSASKYPTGALVQSRETGIVWYVKNGTRHHILDNALLTSRFNSEPPILIKEIGLSEFTIGNPVAFEDGALIGLKGTQNVYVISDQSRRLIPSEEVFYKYDFRFENVHWVNEELFYLHNEGPLLT